MPTWVTLGPGSWWDPTLSYTLVKVTEEWGSVAQLVRQDKRCCSIDLNGPTEPSEQTGQLTKTLVFLGVLWTGTPQCATN